MRKDSRPLLFDVLLHRWPWRVLILFTSFTATVAGLGAPWFQKEFVDHLTGQASALTLPWFSEPLPWILLAFASLLLSQGLGQLTNYLGAREAIFMQGVFSNRLYEKMISLRSDTMSKRSLGEIVSLYATDVPGATVFLDQTLPTGASTLFPLIITPFALAAFFHTPLLPTFILIASLVALNTFLAFRQSKFFYRFKQLAAERTGLVNEWIQNIRTLRILGWTSSFEAKIFKKREAETENRVAMVTNGQFMNSVSTSVTFALNIAALALLTVWSPRPLSPGEILAVLWIIGVFLIRPFRQMPWFFTFAFDAWTSLQRLQDFLRTENRETLPIQIPLLPIDDSLAIDVQGLKLMAGPRTLIENFTLRVKQGEFVAIVGEVGSGKSLLLLSLLKETGAYFARYRLGKTDALQLSEAQLREHFSYVPQEGFIISATLRDNVAFDYESRTELDPAILKSLKSAQFDLSQERVEAGLETEIGERGVNLSGGQKQRVSLARAHFSNGPLLLLDDCLSAVDVETEEKLLQGLLQGEWGTRTRLLVTHRLTVLPKVDRVLFLREGRLLQEGTYEELLANCAEFREFTLSVRRLEATTADDLPLALEKEERLIPVQNIETPEAD